MTPPPPVSRNTNANTGSGETVAIMLRICISPRVVEALIVRGLSDTDSHDRKKYPAARITGRTSAYRPTRSAGFR
jgi:hypothetical protein